MESLNQQKRLIIPSHVLKEFFKNRPKKIVEIIQTVQQFKDSLPSIKEIKNIATKIPSLDYLSCNEEIQKAEGDLEKTYKRYNENLKEYRKKLAELINELKSFFNSDPILNKYEEIFKSSYYKPDTLKDDEEMIKEFNNREKNNIPPGLKDGQKSENFEGDYIIWEHILQIKNSDVIFISADNKPDWVYKETNGNLINARRELVEEFYEKSKGKSFCIIHPSVFIKAYNPSVNKEVIQDLDTTLNEFRNEYIFEIKESEVDRNILLDKLINVLSSLNVSFKYYVNYNKDWEIYDIIISTDAIWSKDVLENIKLKLKDSGIEVIITPNNF